MLSCNMDEFILQTRFNSISDQTEFYCHYCENFKDANEFKYLKRNYEIREKFNQASTKLDYIKVYKLTGRNRNAYKMKKEKIIQKIESYLSNTGYSFDLVSYDEYIKIIKNIKDSTEALIPSSVCIECQDKGCKLDLMALAN